MKLVSLGFRPYLKSDLKTGSNAPLFFFSLFFLISFLHWGRFSNGMHRAQCITGGISTTNVAFVSRANNPPCRLPLPAPRDSSVVYDIHFLRLPVFVSVSNERPVSGSRECWIRWIDWKWKKEIKKGKGFIRFKKKTFLKGFFFSWFYPKTNRRMNVLKSFIKTNCGKNSLPIVSFFVY